MKGLTRYIPFRISENEYNRLKEEAEKRGCKNFSEFVRDSLLENNGLCSMAVKKQMMQLQWEVNKIGTNINQAARRINSGYGSGADVKRILSNQEELVRLMERYLDEVGKVWQ